MPIATLSHYMKSKYKHEQMLEVYVTEMLRIMTFGQHASKVPSYREFAADKRDDRSETEYTDDDIIAMFEGTGTLA